MPDVLMPRLSDTMTEGVVSQWLKAEGDEVRRGDVLAEIETDKAVMDLEALDEGVLQKRLVPEGATVPIGTPIAIIGDSGAGTAAPAAAPPATESPAPPAAESPEEPKAAKSPVPPAPETAPPTPRDAQPAPAAEQKIRTSPLARRIAREHGIDLATIKGSGPHGRILRADVEEAIAATKAAPTSAPPAAAPQPAATAAPPAEAPAADVEEIRLTAVRRITAERLTESVRAPHFYLTSVVDAGRLLDFRADINKRLAADGTKVSVTDMLIKACAVTLRAHPDVNSSWGGDKILRHRRIHVGLAVAIKDGLIVPVVRDADRKSLAEIAAEAHELAGRARAGKLKPEEFRGGTFTISNLGMYGIDHFTAVINPPEAAILAVGAATEEPVVRDGELATRRTIKLTLSIDHRVVDGAIAAEFLRDLKETLEEPLRIVV